MKYIAEIDIMPLKALLDPQGKAVTSSLANLQLSEIDNVRIGKHIRLEINADNSESAKDMLEEACQKLLVNRLMESYEYSLQPAQ